MRFWFFGPRFFGVRTGISIGPEDFARFAGQPRTTASAGVFDPDHGFIYVVTDANGLCKIGITGNPNQRLAQLQSKSAAPLQFAWIGAPKADTIAIEREAHTMLDKYRRAGEWFAVSPDAAVGAINAAAFRLGQPVLGLTVDQVEQISQIASQQQQRKPSSALGRVGVAVLQLVVGMIIAGGLIIFLFVRLARIF